MLITPSVYARQVSKIFGPRPSALNERWGAIVLGLLREEWELARSGPGEARP
jgi:hypothetical protein